MHNDTTDNNSNGRTKSWHRLLKRGLKNNYIHYGFKNLVYQPVCTKDESAQFFVLNPLKEVPGRATGDNIACYKNFLLEFDKCSLKQQDKIIEMAALPYTLKTFSGNKSYHYIISLDRPVTKEEYTEMVGILYTRFPTADKSCANPNRLTRTPGAKRQDRTGAEQTLVEMKDVVKVEDFWHWLTVTQLSSYLVYKIMKEEASRKVQAFRALVEELRTSQPSDMSEQLLTIYRPNWEKELEYDSVLPGDRHARAVSLAIALYRCGKPIEDVLEKIEIFLYNNGKDEATSEANSIIAWVTRNIIPFETDEVKELLGE